LRKLPARLKRCLSYAVGLPIRYATMAADRIPKTGELHLPPRSRSLISDIGSVAILSVYNKTGLLDLAKGLIQNNVRLLASGGTAKLIREAGFQVE